MTPEITRAGVSAVLLLLVGEALYGMARERRGRHGRRRLGSLLGAPVERLRRPARTRRPRAPSWAGEGAVAFLAAAGGWALAGPLAALVATGLALGVARLRRAGRRRARAAAADEETARHLPLAADLLAACAAAGAGPAEAALAVGRSMGGPLGERLTRTAAELRLGGEPAEVWRRFGAVPGAEGLARCMERAGASGAPAAEAVARHAAGLRAARARTAAARARRAQVLISAPVGLCFLPAFLAVGVAPVVIGLATELMAR
ncbi:type II secretion system F family protein [Streptomyces sp.]|uniref:type II secretion system F family protein n=2 Tax=Streptomyces sp. TaxID=1931 RepID=UPI0028128145|nr:type II secretion system F family protein [Streptomyces sp.]